MQPNLRSLRFSLPPFQWRMFIKPLMVAVVVILSAAIGRQASLKIVMGLGAVLAGILGYLILSKKMEWGIVAVVPVTFLITRNVSTGRAVPLNSTIIILIALFAIWLLRMLVIEKSFHLVPSPVNLPALLFIVCVTISLVIGNLSLIPQGEQASIGAQFGGWLIYAFSAGSLLLVGNHIHETRWLKWYLWLFMALGAVYLAVSWRYGVAGANARFFQNGISTGPFWTMLAAVGFGMALCHRDLAWRWRLLAGGIVVMSLAFGWIRGKEWVSGWLPPLMAVGIILWLHDWRLGLFVTLVGALAIMPRFAELLAEVNTDSQQWSAYSRFLTWPIMFELVKVNPVFGLGPSNYYHYTHLYTIYGYNVAFNSHNQYWDLAAQYGLLGLGTFIWMIVALVRVGFSVMRQAKDSFTRSYAIIALALLAADLASGMLADWLLPFIYNISTPGFRTSIMSWMVWGGLISLSAIQKKSQADQDQKIIGENSTL